MVRAMALHPCGPPSCSEALGEAFSLSASSNEGQQVYLLHRVIMTVKSGSEWKEQGLDYQAQKCLLFNIR